MGVMEVFEDRDFGGQVLFELFVQLAQVDGFDGDDSLTTRRALEQTIS